MFSVVWIHGFHPGTTCILQNTKLKCGTIFLAIKLAKISMNQQTIRHLTNMITMTNTKTNNEKHGQKKLCVYLCFLKCLFLKTNVSLCRAGFVQNVAGKQVSNSVCSKKPTKNTGNLNKSKRTQLLFVFRACNPIKFGRFLFDGKHVCICQTSSAVLCESAIKPRFFGSVKTTPRTHCGAVRGGISDIVSTLVRIQCCRLFFDKIALSHRVDNPYLLL